MPTRQTAIQAVATNIITGFLGAGKTSAVLNLLAQKPAAERWAVLVNEFGEVGVDGSLLAAHSDQKQTVFIREVPGGCMCCTAGLPMQVALNQLLQQARPDRLLIEPSGLGHTKEVLDVLTAENYRGVLALGPTLTLVDARKLSDQRYAEHPTFQQQVAIADILIGNKSDLYGPHEQQQLVAYAKRHAKPNVILNYSQHAQVPLSNLKPADSANRGLIFHSLSPTRRTGENLSFKPQRQRPQTNEGFDSRSWRFKQDQVFNYQRLKTLLSTLKAERIKASCISDQGCIAINLSGDGWQQSPLSHCVESRFDVIASEFPPGLEEALLTCLVG